VEFGTDAMKQRVVPDVLLGNKFICLAISEPGAGSDVAGLKCSATLVDDGSGAFVVNGNKKWITNGELLTRVAFVTCVAFVTRKYVCRKRKYKVDHQR
jgi:alkylation response protein AidB-like acyl-CoA dehydrogenase